MGPEFNTRLYPVVPIIIPQVFEFIVAQKSDTFCYGLLQNYSRHYQIFCSKLVKSLKMHCAVWKHFNCSVRGATRDDRASQH